MADTYPVAMPRVEARRAVTLTESVCDRMLDITTGPVGAAA
ncbi:hypothetical protein MGWOODY_Hyp1489 [hydrothermal vent metagenome]|uniref:Uncharacterized protein n=1 Tax=hydrothermal vent metagenome TaxID=652676 RepID=A0A160U1K4_9ZZZZ